MANTEKCVCCGAVIPEGRQVCPSCENKKAIYAEDLIQVLRDDININGANLARVRRHIEAAPAVEAISVSEVQKMANEKLINQICTIQRGLGIIECVASGLANDAASQMLYTAAEMIGEAVEEITEDDK